jgi:hypothetical protein
MRSIQIAKSLFLLLLAMSFALPALAQSERSGASSARQLRFASGRPVEHLRLQVHDAAGALIHDSGLVAKSDLVWSMLDSKGDALKSGLYDWTLTVKEPGEATPRFKRGQINLENTNEPNGASPLATVTVGGSGTVGAIPKWTTATDLGDSVIVEDNGNVAIGTSPSGIIKLRVFLKPADRDLHETIQAVLSTSHYDDPNNDAFDGQSTGSAVAGYATNTVGGTSGVTGVSYSKHGIGLLGSAVSETGKTFGVRAASKSPEGIGVQGAADSTTGENIGVRGESKSNSGIGVYGIASEATGVNYGVKGESASPNGYAGKFVGNVDITGTLTKGMGTFKIDHPLDPENKYLYHSFVESPDMMNIYNGIVTLGKDGSAVVTLPDWFEALNREFRYQLTCIGGFAPVYVAKKVNENRFEIAGGKPGMEVSWQLTGVRKDAYAEAHRVQVEEMKPVAERGSYLHPEAFGKSAEKGAQQAYEKAQQR